MFNLKEQMKNVTWWLSFVSAMAMLLQLFGIKLPEGCSEVVNSMLGIFVALGILNNNNTPGLGE